MFAFVGFVSKWLFTSLLFYFKPMFQNIREKLVLNSPRRNTHILICPFIFKGSVLIVYFSFLRASNDLSCFDFFCTLSIYSYSMREFKRLSGAYSHGPLKRKKRQIAVILITLIYQKSIRVQIELSVHIWTMVHQFYTTVLNPFPKPF